MDFRLPADVSNQTYGERARESEQGHRFAILSPGAGWGAKQWPAERYGELAQRLAELGLESLVNFGPGEDELANAVVGAGAGKAKKVSRPLGSLMKLMRNAALLVGGDTGPVHLAAAVGTPVVALFGPTDPARNGPLGSPSVVLRSPLSGTSHKRRTEFDPGLLSITVEQVLAAA